MGVFTFYFYNYKEKLKFHLQVGMAATLAGVCQVPLTAVLLLFELTQDYPIVLPLLAAVGLSSWITSGQTRRYVKEAEKLYEGNTLMAQQLETVSSDASCLSSGHVLSGKELFVNNLCEVEGFLCIEDSSIEMEVLKKIFVSDAMITRYVTVLMNTSLTEAVTLMLAEKQSCAMIVDDENILIGLLTLANFEQFSKIAKGKNRRLKELLVSELCAVDGEKC
uniref:Chloride channel protein n=1 Tax=Rhizophora mucronata TaxID=61149 RepID=A0A2P2KC20_RHIMU